MQSVFLAGRSVRLRTLGGGACAFQHFSSKWVLALSYKDTKIGEKSELRRTSAVFSLVARSANQMFFRGGEISGTAVGCAFLPPLGGFLVK